MGASYLFYVLGVRWRECYVLGEENKVLTPDTFGKHRFGQSSMKLIIIRKKQNSNVDVLNSYRHSCLSAAITGKQ